jgi:single-strand DNA-binding protein
MASVNKVILIGRLGNQPEVRYTSNTNRPVTELRIATGETWTGQDGQRRESTEWHSVVVWGKDAENCGRYLSKGREVYVEGRIASREYTDRDNQKRRRYEIVASVVRFLGSRQDSAGEPRGREDPQPPPPQDRSPAPGMQGPPDDYAALDDDIPF